MSNAILTASLLDAIRVCVLGAWGAVTVDYGQPRTARVAPYAIVYADSVAVSFGGLVSTVTNTSQENNFTIVGRFPFPGDSTDNIELEKIAKANAFIALAQASGGFATVGMFPIVTGVDFTEPDDPNEQVYEVTLTFSVLTQASHH